MKLFQKFIFAACLSEAKRPEKSPKKVIKSKSYIRSKKNFEFFECVLVVKSHYEYGPNVLIRNRQQVQFEHDIIKF